MVRHRIGHGDYAATVTEWGARLAALEHAGRPLTEAFADDGAEDRYRGAVLAPWPNRTAGGVWEHEGRSLRLPVTEPERGHAHHGLVASAAWATTLAAPDAVELIHRLHAIDGYPWELVLAIRYSLDDSGLTVRLSATLEAGPGPAPMAVGFHPYLTAGSAVVGDDVLELPGRTRVLVDEALIPVGAEPVTGTAYDFVGGRRLGAQELDDCWTDLASPVARLTGTDGVTELWADASLPWLQAFTHPDRRTVAVEPMSAPADALNSGEGLTWVDPGATATWTWGLRRG
ncbi:aldose 1-epimerase family protein [Alteromonas gracilis]